MGQFYSYPGIERLFDKEYDTIDLRDYIKKKSIENPVFIGIIYNGDHILLMNYLDDIWFLGKIKEKSFMSNSDFINGIVTTEFGRKYIIYYFLDEIPYHGPIKVLDRYLL